MKLRCTTNSIRLRLRRSEVDELLAKESISDTVHFGPANTFRFSLRLTEEVADLQADLQDQEIKVLVAREAGLRWLRSEQVGLEARQALEQGKSLHLLVEKDFPCQTRPDEDKTDFFGELQTDEVVC